MNSTLITQSGQFSDAELSYAYSACDATFLPSLGEGFGYPVVESLACGVPCVTGSYGGAAELIPNEDWLVEPLAERLDTMHNCLRPVYTPVDFAELLDNILQEPVAPEVCTTAVEHLDW